MKIYMNRTVLEEALDRMRFIYDHEENIYVPSSGGKDSTVCTELAVMVAKEKGRLPVDVCFLDQESEYQATIDYFRKLEKRKEIRLHWFQVPFRLGNNTSLDDRNIWLHSWNPAEKDKWIREQEPNSIHDLGELQEGTDARFYHTLDLMGDYVFGKGSRYVAIVGMRAQESIRRFILMNSKMEKPVYFDKPWASHGARENTYRLYPIYDWCVSDVWKFISNNKFSYNEMYDKMFKMGVPSNNMRVSSLIHETGVHGLKILQVAEPQTFDKLVNRIGGINTYNQMHKTDMYAISKLPAMFKSWKEYRDYLLITICSEESRKIFMKAFYKDRDGDDELIKSQVNTILMNDICLTKYGNTKRAKINKERYNKGK